MGMLVVVGGHSRNIGKTAVVAGLIRALPQWHWTAVKITQFGHGVCSASGTGCECSVAPEHPYALSEEQQPNGSDSGRFLAAGARRSYWLRTAPGRLREALPAVREIQAANRNVIIESNSIVEFIDPVLYLVVLDFAKQDFKESSLRFLERADACVTLEHGMAQPVWIGLPRADWESKPRFAVCPPQYVTAELAAFVNGRLAAAGASG